MSSMIRVTLLACCLCGIGLLQVCDADRQIIINEEDVQGSCTGTCDSFGEIFEKKGCAKISGCRLSSEGWNKGFVRCDFCVCNCEEDLEGKDITVETKRVSVEEGDVLGTCTGTCDRSGLVRTNFMGCQEVRDCYKGSTGYTKGFVRCDYCTCTCINRRHAVSYELVNVQYDLNGMIVQNGKPTALSETILVNKDPNNPQVTQTTVSIKHSETETMETTESLQTGLTVTVSAKVTIEKVFEVGTEVSTSITKGWEYTAGSSTTTERTFSVTPTIIVPAASSTSAIISGSVVKIDIPYTADLVKTFEDGTTFSSPTSGVYSDVETGRFTITYEAPIAAGICPEGWEAFDRTCYILAHSSSKTFHEAKQDCTSRGATLATIHSAEENIFLAGLMKDDVGSYAIGLSDRANEGTFAWSDGTNLDYTNWAPNEPNSFGGNEDCVGMRIPVRKWNDFPCQLVTPGYICQQKAKDTDG